MCMNPPPFSNTNAQTNHTTKNAAAISHVYKCSARILSRALIRRGLDRAFRQFDCTQPYVFGVASDEHTAAAQRRRDDERPERAARGLLCGVLPSLLDLHDERAVLARKAEREIFSAR